MNDFGDARQGGVDVGNDKSPEQRVSLRLGFVGCPTKPNESEIPGEGVLSRVRFM